MKEGIEYPVEYRVSNGHGEHVITTQFNLSEIKKYKLREVIKYHAKRLQLSDKYACHVKFSDDDTVVVNNTKNCIGNLVSKEVYNRVITEVREVERFNKLNSIIS